MMKYDSSRINLFSRIVLLERLSEKYLTHENNEKISKEKKRKKMSDKREIFRKKGNEERVN